MGAAETPTSICNIALARIGAKEITSFENDNSREAVLCRRLFHPSRRRALAAHHWSAARRDVALTRNSNVSPIFFTYCYTLPSDFIRMVSVHPSDDPNAFCEYAIQEANDSDDGVVLMADPTTIYIRYIFDQTDITALGEGFKEVLNFVLSRDLCMALGKSAAKFELTNKEYRRALAVGKSIDGMQDYPDRLADGSWIRARFGPYTDRTIVTS